MSFETWLKSSSSSNQKLKILHDFIATQIQKRFKNPCFKVNSISVLNQKEQTICGRFFYNKRVDVVINENNQPICGVAIKFVMSNYLQNANNYFENMLGETANIRANNYPYFQILIIDALIPYFKTSGLIAKWEDIKQQHFDKYQKLSHLDPKQDKYIPNQTLIYVYQKVFKNQAIDLKRVSTKYEYYQTCLENEFEIIKDDTINWINFGQSVVINDLKKFIETIIVTIDQDKS